MIEMVAMESMEMIMMNYTNSYNLTHLGHVVANIGQIFTFMGHLTPFKIAACVARKILRSNKSFHSSSIFCLILILMVFDVGCLWRGAACAKG